MALNSFETFTCCIVQSLSKRFLWRMKKKLLTVKDICSIQRERENLQKGENPLRIIRSTNLFVHSSRLFVNINLLQEYGEILEEKCQNWNERQQHHLKEIKAPVVYSSRMTTKNVCVFLFSYGGLRLVWGFRCRCGWRWFHRKCFHFHHKAYDNNNDTFTEGLI